MSERIATAHAFQQLSPGTRRSLLACGLWMRAAFIGASATTIGVIQLVEGGWSTINASSAVVAGVALTVVAYLRGQAAVSQASKRSTIAATPAAAHR